VSLSLLLAIGVGGFFGSISRFLVAYEMSQRFGASFPYGTLTVNAVGSFILGFSSRYLLEHWLVNDLVRLGLTVGFLGAFTTFSTFSYESILLLQEGELTKAGLNIFANGFCCLTLSFFGLQLTKII